jgi:hypothetical protein
MQPVHSESLVIRMDGAFDIESVQAIQSRLADLPGDAEVYVDLSRVRDFHDSASTSTGCCAISASLPVH